MAAITKPSATEMLAQFHMPPGLLPDTVTDYILNADGSFTCTLSKVTYVTFGTGSEAKEVSYAKKLKGMITDMQLTQLSGVTTKKLFIWISVTSITRESPDSTTIKFSAGPVGLPLPTAWFEKQPVSRFK